MFRISGAALPTAKCKTHDTLILSKNVWDLIFRKALGSVMLRFNL